MTRGVLVVGYGSTLRTDDGVGRAAAQRLVTDPRLDGATVIACHQLAPELALDLSQAAFAVLIVLGIAWFALQTTVLLEEESTVEVPAP